MSRRTWIFQGNPNRFDIDEYLSQYPVLIYWRTNRYKKLIEIGDQVFIWRAGSNAGVIAEGEVVEIPILENEVRYPEALGNELWRTTESHVNELKTGIRLNDIRLVIADGMVQRKLVQNDPDLCHSMIIKVPTGTVFRLRDEESRALNQLWFDDYIPKNFTSADGTVSEGQRHLRAHYVRERSSQLRQRKIDAMLAEQGFLCCEICGFTELKSLPDFFIGRSFEIHHKLPLALSNRPVRTTLEDLAVLCANCHRLVHTTSDVVHNVEILTKL